jgi:hypothetical protein
MVGREDAVMLSVKMKMKMKMKMKDVHVFNSELHDYLVLGTRYLILETRDSIVDHVSMPSTTTHCKNRNNSSQICSMRIQKGGSQSTKLNRPIPHPADQ